MTSDKENTDDKGGDEPGTVNVPATTYEALVQIFGLRIDPNTGRLGVPRKS